MGDTLIFIACQVLGVLAILAVVGTWWLVF